MGILPIAALPIANPAAPSLGTAMALADKAVVPATSGEAFNVTLSEETSPSPQDTTLLQAAQPVIVTDTTLLQAEIDAGTAIAPPLQGGVAPAPSLELPLSATAPIPVTFLEELGQGPVSPGEANPALPVPFATWAADDLALAAGTSTQVPGLPNPLAEALAAAEHNPESLVQADASMAEATVLQTLVPLVEAGSTQLQVDVAASQAASVPDPQALAVATQTALILDTRMAVLAAMQAGASDVTLMLSGLPQGSMATLLGGGWVQIPAGSNGVEAAGTWAFHFPFGPLEVPPVTPASLAAHTEVKGRPSGGVEALPSKGPQAEVEGGPSEPRPGLTSYGSHGEKESSDGGTVASTLDLMD